MGSRVPTDNIPVALFVPIAYLKDLGDRPEGLGTKIQPKVIGRGY